MNWKQLLSFQRVLSPKQEVFDPARSPFNVDYDRVIFSDSFRRLDEKTQVHPLKDNDNVHSRLSHSLEVSSVGRSLGNMAGGFLKEKNLLPEEFTPDHTGQIVQTACLAHDIGNPPFGHAGESIIQNWFRNQGAKYTDGLSPEQLSDFQNFEGNAQALRIVTRLGMYRNKGGLRPTYAFIASMMKYPWVKHNATAKFCCFTSEKEILTEIACAVGLKGDNYVYCRHPLAYLSEAADDICYSIIDIEDAYEMGIISFEEAKDALHNFCCISQNDLTGKTKKETIAYYRARSINVCVDAVINEFKSRYEEIIKADLEYRHNLFENSALAKAAANAKELGRKRIYTNPRKVLLETGAVNILGVLLENFCSAAYRVCVEKKTDFNSAGLMALMGDWAVTEDDTLFEALHKVTDYISGMTDSYAAETAKHMKGV